MTPRTQTPVNNDTVPPTETRENDKRLYLIKICIERLQLLLIFYPKNQLTKIESSSYNGRLDILDK